MAAVMIGVDPHKGSHTAVAISSDEEQLGRLRVRASVTQAERLVTWAAGVAGADLGGRGRGRARSPAGPAAGRGGRAGGGRAAEAGCPGAAAGDRGE